MRDPTLLGWIAVATCLLVTVRLLLVLAFGFQDNWSLTHRRANGAASLVNSRNWKLRRYAGLAFQGLILLSFTTLAVAAAWQILFG